MKWPLAFARRIAPLLLALSSTLFTSNTFCFQIRLRYPPRVHQQNDNAQDRICFVVVFHLFHHASSCSQSVFPFQPKHSDEELMQILRALSRSPVRGNLASLTEIRVAHPALAHRNHELLRHFPASLPQTSETSSAYRRIAV
jgi:hypothetical protein